MHIMQLHCTNGYSKETHIMHMHVRMRVCLTLSHRHTYTQFCCHLEPTRDITDPSQISIQAI